MRTGCPPNRRHVFFVLVVHVYHMLCMCLCTESKSGFDMWLVCWFIHFATIFTLYFFLFIVMVICITAKIKYSFMAYIPPHKRHSEDSRKQSPTPELLVPQFKKNIKLSSSRKDSNKAGKIIYAAQAISTWFAIGLEDNDRFPSSVHLEPVLLEFFENKFGGKPLALLKHDVAER